MPLIASHTTKFVFIGMITMVVYSSMVIDIIQIIKTHENQNNNTYPPAVVAMLVASILQLLWGVWYLVRNGRGAAFKASSVAGATVFFLLFHLGATIAATVLRFNERYCPRDATNFIDCRGCMRGTMGLGYSAVGLNFFFLIYLFLLVPRHGRWNEELYNIPARRHPNADFEKAPAH